MLFTLSASTSPDTILNWVTQCSLACHQATSGPFEPCLFFETGTIFFGDRILIHILTQQGPTIGGQNCYISVSVIHMDYVAIYLPYF